MATFTYTQLEQLWEQAGGGSHTAPVAAAIAVAESGGHSGAKHHDANGSTDYGLWQINSSHGYNPQKLLSDPAYNAHAAVAVYHSQGWAAWTTYRNGAYKNYLAGGNQMTGGSSLGVISQANYNGTDQGVDFKGKGAIPALDQALVTDVGSTSIIEGGRYPYVVYRLQQGPYKGHFVYVMEDFKPKVHVGQNLRKGQEIGYANGGGIGIEIGFNASERSLNPVSPLYPDPHGPKPAGIAMWNYIKGLLGGTSSLTQGPSAQASPNPPPPGGALGALLGGITGPFESIAGFFEKLTDPNFWLRAAEVIGGGILVLLGLYLLAKQVGLAADVPNLAAVTPGGRLAEGAAAEMQFSAGRENAARRKPRRTADTSEAGTRREAVRRRAASSSDPSTNDIPF